MIFSIGYHFGPNDLNTVEESVLTYHRIAEAFKFAYARRSDLGDEDFLDIEEVSWPSFVGYQLTNFMTE